MKTSVMQGIEAYFDRLWPICRSISGNGVRESLKILQELIPLEIIETDTGTKAFDWTVPKEWNVRNAYIETMDGEKLIDFKENNLHLMSYSVPVNRTLRWNELKSHLYYLEDLLDAIPYRTSYYKEDWGFCLSKNQYDKLSKKDEYKVFIDTQLEAGSLTYGELVLPGKSDREVFFSSYICHPSMANNELSGPLLLAFLYREINKIKDRKFTYRFLIAPETIGSIIYLHKHGAQLKSKMLAGYILTCTGLDQPLTYKRSRRKNAYNDRVAEYALKNFSLDKDYNVIDFFPFGSDERQYCSPGFNLPVGSIARGMYGQYPEYHTSLDNKSLLSFKALEEMLTFYSELVAVIENDIFYLNINPECEPQLGKRGVYPNTGGKVPEQAVYALMWVLNQSDGNHSIREIALQSELDYGLIHKAAQKLVDCELLQKLY